MSRITFQYEFTVDMRVKASVEAIVHMMKEKKSPDVKLTFFCEGPYTNRKRSPIHERDKVKSWVEGKLGKIGDGPKDMEKLLTEMLKKNHFDRVEMYYHDLRCSVIINK